ncbi:MAG TPA: zinc ribbon domain-containing protein [Vicinamibacterales bacterium]|nr:zinc ribbon domain-containing protein [Vicinamibacterales bacterium]
MPIYEYECRACGHRFERLIRPASSSNDGSVACPACQSQELERLLSLFAVSSDATIQRNVKEARRLGQGERREKLQADIEATEHHH